MNFEMETEEVEAHIKATDVQDVLNKVKADVMEHPEDPIARLLTWQLALTSVLTTAGIVDLPSVIRDQQDQLQGSYH